MKTRARSSRSRAEPDKIVKSQEIKIHGRRIYQDAILAIRDVYDALVELITNADDRYQLLDIDGRIEVEVVKRRGGDPSLIRVRDFADGMTSSLMDQKLGEMGNRVSGLEEGMAVRGTNSRGAKDVAALGQVTFESIAQDGRFHRCWITPRLTYERAQPREASDSVRTRLGIPAGTGTVVTIEVAPRHTIPRHSTLVTQLGQLVRLAEILKDPRREVILRRPQQEREDVITYPQLEGTKRVSVRFGVPGYPDAEAKLLVFRASEQFPREKDRSRLGGILIRSRRAIHEATYFDPSLESDPCARWFYGRLTCEAIDDLWNEFDERYASEMELEDSNPRPILDPSRRSGLTRDHPFVEALFAEALKRFRPLVEEERKREANQRSRIESRKTRQRLDALEEAANEFIEEWSEDEEDDNARGGDTKKKGRRFRELGYVVSPPYTQLVRGHSRNYSLRIMQDSFPEIEPGSSVQIEPLTDEIEIDKRFATLEPDPTHDGELRATWAVKGTTPTPATGLKVRVGPIKDEAVIAVLESEADRYAHVTDLAFSSRRYRIRTDKARKRVRLLAPLSLVDQHGTDLELEVGNSAYAVSGETRLVKRDELGVAIANVTIKMTREDPEPSILKATLGDRDAEAKLLPTEPPGTGIHIKLEDVDHVHMRYRWKKNELEIAARHRSLARYLGPAREGFPGQEDPHFRVLLAEIVADAVCSDLLRRNIEANPIDYENADWNTYYADFSEYMTEFLPIAHKLVLPDA